MAKHNKNTPEISGKIVANYFGVDQHQDDITWHSINKKSDGAPVRGYPEILKALGF